MKATLKTPDARNARNLGGKLETVSTMKLVCLHDGKLTTACDARFYMARSADGASPVQCVLWTPVTSGYGRATGYGYHKDSAALSAAIESAGFELDTDIPGVGGDAMRSALLAIAQACGIDTTVHLFV